MGPSIDVQCSGTSFVGQALFRGCIAVTHWKRNEVDSLLPSDLVLASNLSSTPEDHPVVFLFGEQREGTLLYAGVALPTGIGYGEFALAIPFVHHRDGRHLHTFVPRMYSAYPPAVWSGNLYYGFGKEQAQMWWQGPVFLLCSLTGPLLFHAAIEQGLPVARSSQDSSDPDLATLQAIFAMPVLGRRASGSYVCSYFDWDFQQALVHRAESVLSVDASFVHGLTPRTCHGDATFAVDGMLWKLSWPSPCRL
jgi:hypothetical protein